MVHVRVCPLEKRAEGINLYYKGRRPQIYCRGHKNSPFDDYRGGYNPECTKCKDWIHNNQVREDINDYINSLD